MHLWSSQPTPREVYSVIQAAIDFRYGDQSDLGITPSEWRAPRVQRESWSCERLYEYQEEQSLSAREQTYLSMLRALLDENWDWGRTNEHAASGTDCKHDHMPKDRLQTPHSAIDTNNHPYAFSKRVRDALVLDNFRRREYAGILVPRPDIYDGLLRKALFKLRRRYQLILLGRQRLTGVWTLGLQFHYTWERFGNHFLVRELQQEDIPEAALLSLHGAKLSSFDSISPNSLFSLGIRGNTAHVIVAKAQSLQYDIWASRLRELTGLGNISAATIQHHQRYLAETQLWDRTLVLTQQAITSSNQTLTTAATEIEALQNRRPVTISPNHPTTDLAYQWWTSRLRRADIWCSDSARDLRTLEQEYRAIKLIPAPPPPKRNSPQMNLVHRAVRHAQRNVSPRLNLDRLQLITPVMRSTSRRLSREKIDRWTAARVALRRRAREEAAGSGGVGRHEGLHPLMQSPSGSVEETSREY